MQEPNAANENIKNGKGRKHKQGMNRIFILQKGKWKPFKITSVCDLVFYSESAMQF